MQRKLMMVAVAVVWAALLPAGSARAQIALGASFTAQHIVLDPSQPTGSQGATWIYGPTFQLQSDHGTFLKLGVDLRGSILAGSGVGVDSIDVGPRISVVPHVVRIKPFAEVLVGYLGVRPNANSNFTTHIDLQFVGGIDTTIAPHIDWRVIEYTHGLVPSFSGIADEDKRDQFSTGIMLRFF